MVTLVKEHIMLHAAFVNIWRVRRKNLASLMWSSQKGELRNRNSSDSLQRQYVRLLRALFSWESWRVSEKQSCQHSSSLYKTPGYHWATLRDGWPYKLNLLFYQRKQKKGENTRMSHTELITGCWCRVLPLGSIRDWIKTGFSFTLYFCLQAFICTHIST